MIEEEPTKVVILAWEGYWTGTLHYGGVRYPSPEFHTECEVNTWVDTKKKELRGF